MIPLDKLKSLKRAYVHANCPDGVASALILKARSPTWRCTSSSTTSAEHKEMSGSPHHFCTFAWSPKIRFAKTTH